MVKVISYYLTHEMVYNAFLFKIILLRFICTIQGSCSSYILLQTFFLHVSGSLGCLQGLGCISNATMAFPASRSSCRHLSGVDTQEWNCWAIEYMTSHSTTQWQTLSKGAVLRTIPPVIKHLLLASSLPPLVLCQANWCKMIYLYDLNLHFIKH